ncbi:MAG: hypothetical protein HQL56_03600 [Magnetococcales bacterium]|nr:hypothetical protein [Magnetococcales bacterium]
MNIREQIMGFGWRGLVLTGVVAGGGILLAAPSLVKDGGSARLWMALGAGSLLLGATVELIRRKRLRNAMRRTEPVFDVESTGMVPVTPYEKPSEDGTMSKNILFFSAVLLAFLYLSFIQQEAMHSSLERVMSDNKKMASGIEERVMKAVQGPVQELKLLAATGSMPRMEREPPPKPVTAVAPAPPIQAGPAAPPVTAQAPPPPVQSIPLPVVAQIPPPPPQPTPAAQAPVPQSPVTAQAPLPQAPVAPPASLPQAGSPPAPAQWANNGARSGKGYPPVNPAAVRASEEEVSAPPPLRSQPAPQKPVNAPKKPTIQVKQPEVKKPPVVKETAPSEIKVADSSGLASDVATRRKEVLEGLPPGAFSEDLPTTEIRPRRLAASSADRGEERSDKAAMMKALSVMESDMNEFYMQRMGR